MSRFHFIAPGQQHLVMRAAGGNHRENVFFGIDDKIQEYGSVLHGKSFFQRGFDIGRSIDTHTDMTVSLGQFDEIRQ